MKHILPALNKCLDDLQVVPEHTPVVMVSVQHKVFKQFVGKVGILNAELSL